MTMLKALHKKLHLIYKHIYITSGLFTADILKALLKKENSGLHNFCFVQKTKLQIGCRFTATSMCPRAPEFVHPWMVYGNISIQYLYHFFFYWSEHLNIFFLYANLLSLDFFILEILGSSILIKKKSIYISNNDRHSKIYIYKFDRSLSIFTHLAAHIPNNRK